MSGRNIWQDRCCVGTLLWQWHAPYAMLNPPRGTKTSWNILETTAATFHRCMVFFVFEAMARPPLTQWTFIKIPLFPCSARNIGSLKSSGSERNETPEATSNSDWHTQSRSTFQSLQMNVDVGVYWNVSPDLFTRPQPHLDRYPLLSSIRHRQNPLARLHSRPDGSDPLFTITKKNGNDMSSCLSNPEVSQTKMGIIDIHWSKSQNTIESQKIVMHQNSAWLCHRFPEAYNLKLSLRFGCSWYLVQYSPGGGSGFGGALPVPIHSLQFVCYRSQEYRKLALSSGLWLLATCTACSEIRFGVGTCQKTVWSEICGHPQPGLSLHFFGILHISRDLESWSTETQALAKHTRARTE